VHEYQTRSAPMMGRMMADLAQGQEPTVLFLTCSDSRVVPNLITGSGPGDLFTIRNIANLVPAGDDDSTIAAIEYAIEVLGISTVVICGHSGCGGMRALLARGEDAPADSALTRWLRAADDSLVAWRAISAEDSPTAQDSDAQADALARINVAVQLERLDELPVVRDAVLAGRLQLAGLFYDIGTAQVELLDRDTSVFAAPASRLSGVVGQPR
jgi:carbonic anhydrase